MTRHSTKLMTWINSQCEYSSLRKSMSHGFVLSAPTSISIQQMAFRAKRKQQVSLRPSALLDERIIVVVVMAISIIQIFWPGLAPYFECCFHNLLCTNMQGCAFFLPQNNIWIVMRDKKPLTFGKILKCLFYDSAELIDHLQLFLRLPFSRTYINYNVFSVRVRV